MKNIILFLTFWSQSILIIAQTHVGGLLISDKEKREAASTTLLELSSSTRGVLMPRMTYENMMAINNPADGLLVFVTSSIEHGASSRGFYFYDEVVRKNWVKLETQSNSTYQAEPIGTIVGFSGKVAHFFNPDGTGIAGTDYEGWRICNGMGGTPDLTDRFLVGAATSADYESKINEKMLNGLAETNPDLDDAKAHKTDYDIVGKLSADQSEILITPANIPIHNHEPKQLRIMQSTHSHHFPLLSHSHSYERATGRSGDEKYPQEAKNEDSEEWMQVKGTTPDIDTEDNISLTHRSDLILNIDFPTCPLEKFGSATPKVISNVPKYYVLGFIIKTAASPFVYQDLLRNDIIFEIYSPGKDSNPYSMTYYKNNAE